MSEEFWKTTAAALMESAQLDLRPLVAAVLLAGDKKGRYLDRYGRLENRRRAINEQVLQGDVELCMSIGRLARKDAP